MIHIFEKVCIDKENPYGIKKIEEGNPFIEGPCVITILAKPVTIMSVNGSMREVTNIVNPDIDVHYDPDRRVFGLGYGDYSEEFYNFSHLLPEKEEVEEFVDKYFCPFFIKDNKKIDVIEAMKNFRNITFVSYCNGAITVNRIENALRDKMTEVGYSDSDINMILSQVCLAAVSGNVVKSRGSSMLAITFGDINDKFYETEDNTKESIKDEGKFINFDNSLGYGISGDGLHNYRRYMTEDPEISPKIAAFINASLDNAIENKNNEVINPITYEKIDKALSENHKSK